MNADGGNTMSKHEAKISRTKVIIMMIIAVVISLCIGIGIGFLISQSKGEAKKTDTSTFLSNTFKKDNTAKKASLTKEEQISIANKALNEYYSVNLDTYNTLKTQSLEESQKTNKPQDTIFKDKLNKLYQNILTKTELASMKSFIDAGDIKTNYYLDFFNADKGAKVQNTSIVEANENMIKAKSQVVNSIEYNTSNKLPSMQDFFDKYKGKGIEQKQYTRLVNLKPSKVIAAQTSDVSLVLEKENGKWLISDYIKAPESAEITEITRKNKVFSLTEFIKTYAAQ
jgi:hypothetical protein